jgi:hypothetical protein
MDDSLAPLIWLFLLLGITGIAIHLWIWSAIFKKAGYSAFMSLLMLLPLVNFLVLLYFAITKWPIEVELARCTPAGRSDRSVDRIDKMLLQANAMEQRGEWEDAAALFDTLAKELEGLPGARFAAQCANRIRQRHLSSPAG